MERVQENENLLLNRREFVFEHAFDLKTPTREEIKKLVVDSFQVDEKLVIVENITQLFCDRKVCVRVYVYENKEALEKVTSKHILKRNLGGKNLKGEKKEKPEEKKKEEKK